MDTARARAVPATTPCWPKSPTLYAALQWLGHECGGFCEGTRDLDASVWFIRLPGATNPGTSQILVVVDLVDQHVPFAVGQYLLRRINQCTRTDHIRVRERRSVDHGHALASVMTSPAAAQRFRYLRPEPDGAVDMPPQLASSPSARRARAHTSHQEFR